MIVICLISGAQWDPHQPRLALCTSSNKLYLWSPTGCVSVEVPAEGKQNPYSEISIESKFFEIT